MENCKKKSLSIKKNTSLNISCELADLKVQLESLNIKIPFDSYEVLYEGYGIEKYFAKRYENRYGDVMIQIDNTIEKEDADGHLFIKKYLDFILVKSGSYWPVTKKTEAELDDQLSGKLCSKIFSCLYPNRPEIDDNSRYKQQVLDFAERYQFKKYLGF